MGDVFKKAISEVAALPEAAQEEIGRQVLEQVEKLQRLRADVAVGLADLAAGRGREIDVEALIQKLHREHGVE